MTRRRSGEPDPTTIERLADHLQTAVLSAQRLLVTSNQQTMDAAKALEAIERSIGVVTTAAARERERQRTDREKGEA